MQKTHYQKVPFDAFIIKMEKSANELGFTIFEFGSLV